MSSASRTCCRCVGYIAGSGGVLQVWSNQDVSAVLYVGLLPPSWVNVPYFVSTSSLSPFCTSSLPLPLLNPILPSHYSVYMPAV